MSAAAAALLIALRCLAPVCPSDSTRAPSYVRCPVCVESWVIIVNEWAYPSPWIEVHDQCNRIHWHDNGTESHTYRCTRCCREWTVEGPTGEPCWCGWKCGDDNSVLLAPCPDIGDEWARRVSWVSARPDPTAQRLR